MSDIEKAAAEALAIAKGEIPAARIYHNGHFYVPQAEVEQLEAALRPFAWYAENVLPQIDKICGDGFYKALQDARATLGVSWKCPINDPDCKSNCGSYGCGN